MIFRWWLTFWTCWLCVSKEGNWKSAVFSCKMIYV